MLRAAHPRSKTKTPLQYDDVGKGQSLFEPLLLLAALFSTSFA
jgi:hypothetical protein